MVDPSDTVCPECGAILANENGECLCCMLGLGLDRQPDSPTSTKNDNIDVPPPGDPLALRIIQLGDYELSEEIARGGMGVVYRAHQLSLNREVAVKVLDVARSRSRQVRQRFAAEAAAAATLDHPNIVPVYETGEDSGRLFLSMKLIEGVDLASWLRRAIGGPGESPPVKERVELLSKVARGVGHAHRRGILHRDLKPGNIVIDTKGEPRVTDFGLAKFIDDEQGMTMTSEVMGTPHYMSPEQCEGLKGVTTATDIFALGVILHELLTGEIPYTGGTSLQVMRKISEAHPPELPGVNPNLRAICRKCLARLPEERYGTGDELAAELEAWLHGEPIAARDPGFIESVWRFARKNRVAVSTAAIVVIFLVAATVISTVSYFRTRTAEEETRRTLVFSDLAAADQHLAGDRPAMAVAHLARAQRNDKDNRMIAEKMLALLAYETFCPQITPPLLQSSGPTHVVWTAEDQRIVTANTDGTLRVWDAQKGEQLHEYKEKKFVMVLSSPNRRALVTESTDGQVFLRDPQTAEPIADLGRAASTERSLAFGPGSKYLVVARGHDGATVHGLPGGERVAHLTGEHFAEIVEFDESGNRVLSACGSAFTVWDWGLERKITTVATGPLSTARFNLDGSMIVTAYKNHMIGEWDAENGRKMGGRTQGIHPCWNLQIDREGQRYAPVLKSVQIYESSWGEGAETIEHPDNIYGFQFLNSGTRCITLGFATAPGDTAARIWDPETGDPLSAPIFHSGGASAFGIDRNHARLATGKREHFVRIWDIRDRELASMRFDLAAGYPWRIDFGSQILRVRGGSGETLRVNLASEELISDEEDRLTGTGREFKSGQGWLWIESNLSRYLPPFAHEGTPSTAVFSPDGRHLVTGSKDGLARIYEVASATPLKPLKHQSEVTCVEFDPSGEYLVSACADGSVHYWAFEKRESLPDSLQAHKKAVRSLCVRGGVIVSGAEDGSAHAWWPKEQRRVGPMAHEAAVRQLEISPSGKWFAAGTVTRFARIWNLEDGSPVTPPLAHKTKTLSCGVLIAFTPDETRLITSGRWMQAPECGTFHPVTWRCLRSFTKNGSIRST